MLQHISPPHQRYWYDLAQVLALIDVYVSIEDPKRSCNKAILEKLEEWSVNDPYYDEPASFIRYRLYPLIMDGVQCAAGTNLSDRELDLFFHKMVMNETLRGLYGQIACNAFIYGSTIVSPQVIYQI